jgi:hypothetical protein
MNRPLIFITPLLFIWLCTSCSHFQGSKAEASRSKGSATRQVLPADVAHVRRAILQAFSNGQYRSMTLDDVEHAPDYPKLRHLQPGYVLYTLHHPIGSIRIGDDAFDYFAYFNIVISPAENGGTEVWVRTVHSEIISGQGFGAHFGGANRYKKVKPVKAHEEAVLNQIVNTLSKTG